jgi:hypothetical protein
MEGVPSEKPRTI